MGPTVDLTLGAVSSGELTIATDATDGTGLGLELWIGWPGGGASLIAGSEPGVASATVATPALTGATFAVVATRGNVSRAIAWRRGLASLAPHPALLGAASI